MVREGRVLISSATDPDFGAGYYVQALEVGAQVASGSSGTTITVRAGHGFAALDKLIVGTDITTYRSVSSVTATTVVVGSAVTVAAGDLLVNLGPDTGSTEPNYDGNGLSIYTDMDYTTLATNRTVLCDANGRYTYYHKGIAIWDLARTGSTPIAIYQSAGDSTVVGVDSTTDNAVVRWDGTTGENVQNSVVTIGDTGAVTGITTLAASGNSTIGGTLGVTGALTASAALTVGTTLGVTGASTLTGAVGCGAVTSTGNVTSGGHIRGLKGTTALTGSTEIATSGQFLIDITNTSGSNTFTLAAPSSVDGQILILRVAAITAGDLSLADSGNVSLSAAWTTPGVGDTLTLVASGVVWYEIARSNN